MIFVHDGDIGTDPCVFIQDGPLHRGAFANTDGNAATFDELSPLFAGFMFLITS